MIKNTLPLEVKRVVFHPIGVRQLFDLRHSQLTWRHQSHIETSLFYLSLYFDEIIIPPGGLFAGFNKAQFGQVETLFSGRVAQLLADENILSTYGDHMEEMDGTSPAVKDPKVYFQFLEDRLKRLQVFQLRKEDFEFVKRRTLISKLNLLPRSVVAANIETASAIENIIEQSLDDKLKHYLSRLLAHVVYDVNKFHHQKLLWSIATGKSEDWRPVGFVDTDILARVESLHQTAKINSKEIVYRYSDQFGPRFQRVDTHSGRRYDPNVLRCLMDFSYGEEDLTPKLLNLSRSSMAQLIKSTKTEGFQAAYHKFLNRHADLDLAVGHAECFEDTKLDSVRLIEAAGKADSSEAVLRNLTSSFIVDVAAQIPNVSTILGLVKAVGGPTIRTIAERTRFRMRYPEMWSVISKGVRESNFE